MAWPLVLLTLLPTQAESPADATPAAAPAIATAPAEKSATPALVKPAPGVANTAQAPAQPVAQPADSIFPMLITFAPLILLFYLLAIRPQQQQERKRRQTVDALKKNDKVLTTAGIYGTVVSVDPSADKVVVRVDDEKQVRFTFSKASIVRVVEPQTEKAADAKS